DKAYIEGCMKKGAESASRLAQRTLDKCMKKIGFKQI
ncbi:MAG TPA: tryptophan--tRNA ligase, partial [Ruminococcaceae bacterium]|nr:tryptophan--tRNA ligase [Oscillospiraceae bacterium]